MRAWENYFRRVVYDEQVSIYSKIKTKISYIKKNFLILKCFHKLFAKKLDYEVQMLEDTVQLSTKRVQSNFLEAKAQQPLKII